MKPWHYYKQMDDDLEAAKGVLAACCISFVSVACVVAVLWLVKGGV